MRAVGLNSAIALSAKGRALRKLSGFAGPYGQIRESLRKLII